MKFCNKIGFPFSPNPKHLDPSYKTGPDFIYVLKEKNPVLQPQKYSLSSLRHRVKSIYSSPLSHCSELIRSDQLFYPPTNSVSVMTPNQNHLNERVLMRVIMYFYWRNMENDLKATPLTPTYASGCSVVDKVQNSNSGFKGPVAVV